MRILHICLCGPVTDNWNYQDNMITKYHKKLGHSVTIVSSQWIWNKEGMLSKCEETDYINNDGVRMNRLQIKGKDDFNRKLKRYDGVYKAISNIQPDIIFVHGCQFLDLMMVVKYIKKNKNVKVYVDNHADLSNSATNWISKNILHKVLWKFCAKRIEPYTTKFYGVLPSRVDFLIDLYKIPEEKVELLVLGADDDKVIEAKSNNIRDNIRKEYGIKSGDFLIITGGKIDFAKKQTLLLMQAVKRLNRKDVKLIVFGSVIEELKANINNFCDGEMIQYIGWIEPTESYKYFASSELVVFPGRHSVFWEQVVGLGIPMIVKHWAGTTHIDIGGNCKFLYKDSVDEIQEIIKEIVNNQVLYEKMKKLAIEKGMEKFSYKEIAKRSIQIQAQNQN